MKIVVDTTPLSPWEALAEYEREVVAPAHPGRYGAAATFVGTMRDFNEGDAVQGMFLEHYPGMTEKQLGLIADEAFGQWSLLDGLLLHRVGELKPSEPIVVVAVWSAHRKDAFEACRFIMEALKSRAPFWKREELHSGSRWVEKNSEGY
ncbi:MAG: molybdenum cofactor biosynthesis protein MoaE [Chromatiales bacterium]|nr:molybdenum cofactor biosynthesis protein MoaE [Chromatiales bacterium]